MDKDLNFILEKEHHQVLFVGVGNVLRKDDGVGVYIVQQIKENQRLKKLIVEVSIENYINKINQINPGTLVIVDCLDFNSEPGYYQLIAIEDTREYAMNSHHISLKRLSEFFTMETWVLGIQPADLTVGENLTTVVHVKADEIIQIINNHPESRRLIKD